ncbi:TetR/AcrR family transcriptional regulator [Mycolicibacterium sp. 050158]|uniref:TetR/AcrR family transcriptional regulator n=1 Tax=Mycolicibacterium sp. 050158 TaxID=3090602 RepID=UPI00299EC50A|nr:TetR/AcrR family transcriptional regulator [Mycolicibacterium sp. 050158]MDX1891724.1 TetR/AcrR family transcriptional regulator [Mycolicibacterium sp. 050158]
MGAHELDATGAKILDAASHVLAKAGPKRTTMDAVGKRAGVSHMTVYRRWASRGELLQAVVLRELTDVLDAAFYDAVLGDTLEASVTRAFGDVVWSVRNHPLVLTVLEAEPEVLLTLNADGPQSVMHTVVPLVAERLRQLAGGALRDDEIDVLADVFVRMAHSMVVVLQPGRRLDTRSEVQAYAARCLGVLSELTMARPLPTVASNTGIEETSGLEVVGSAETSDAEAEQYGRRRQRPYLVAATWVILVAGGISASAAAAVHMRLLPADPAEMSRIDDGPASTTSSVVPQPPSVLPSSTAPIPVASITVTPGHQTPVTSTPEPDSAAAQAPSLPSTTAPQQRGGSSTSSGPAGPGVNPPRRIGPPPPMVFSPPNPAAGPGPGRPGPGPGPGGSRPGGHPPNG